MSRVLAQLDSRFDTGPASSQPRAGSAGGTGRERIAQVGCISASRRIHRRPVLLLRLVLIASSRFGLVSRRSSSATAAGGRVGSLGELCGGLSDHLGLGLS